MYATKHCSIYCSIVICSGCLRSWLYHDNSCPLCQSPIQLTPTKRSSHSPSEVSTSASVGGLREAGVTTTRSTPFQLRNRRNITKFVHKCCHIGTKSILRVLLLSTCYYNYYFVSFFLCVAIKCSIFMVCYHGHT